MDVQLFNHRQDGGLTCACHALNNAVGEQVTNFVDFENVSSVALGPWDAEHIVDVATQHGLVAKVLPNHVFPLDANKVRSAPWTALIFLEHFHWTTMKKYGTYLVHINSMESYQAKFTEQEAGIEANRLHEIGTSCEVIAVWPRDLSSAQTYSSYFSLSRRQHQLEWQLDTSMQATIEENDDEDLEGATAQVGRVASLDRSAPTPIEREQLNPPRLLKRHAPISREGNGEASIKPLPSRRTTRRSRPLADGASCQVLQNTSCTSSCDCSTSDENANISGELTALTDELEVEIGPMYAAPAPRSVVQQREAQQEAVAEENTLEAALAEVPIGVICEEGFNSQRQDTEEMISQVARALRQNPTMPFWSNDVDDGMLWPDKHCAITGCDWEWFRPAEEPFSIRNSVHDGTWQLSCHLDDKHTMIFEGSRTHDSQRVGRFIPSIDIYEAAIAQNEREKVPFIGACVDRRCHRQFEQRFKVNKKGDSLSAAICFVCARIKVCDPSHARCNKCCRVGPRQNTGDDDSGDEAGDDATASTVCRCQHGDLRWVLATKGSINTNSRRVLGLTADKAEKRLGSNTFRERYLFGDLKNRTDVISDLQKAEREKGLKDWLTTVQFSDDNEVELLCCPEDVKCSAIPLHASNVICDLCRVPLCLECEKDLESQTWDPPLFALAHDMFFGYTPSVVYKEKMTVVEMIMCSVCYPHLIQIELDCWGWDLKQKVSHDARNRTGARGNFTCYELRPEDVFAAADKAEEVAATLPRWGPDLQAMVYVVITRLVPDDADDDERAEVEKRLREQVLTTARVRIGVVKDAIKSLIALGKPEYENINMDDVNTRLDNLKDSGKRFVDNTVPNFITSFLNKDPGAVATGKAAVPGDPINREGVEHFGVVSARGVSGTGDGYNVDVNDLQLSAITNLFLQTQPNTEDTYFSGGEEACTDIEDAGSSSDDEAVPIRARLRSHTAACATGRFENSDDDSPPSTLKRSRNTTSPIGTTLAPDCKRRNSVISSPRRNVNSDMMLHQGGHDEDTNIGGDTLSTGAETYLLHGQCEVYSDVENDDDELPVPGSMAVIHQGATHNEADDSTRLLNQFTPVFMLRAFPFLFPYGIGAPDLKKTAPDEVGGAFPPARLQRQGRRVSFEEHWSATLPQRAEMQFRADTGLCFALWNMVFRTCVNIGHKLHGAVHRLGCRFSHDEMEAAVKSIYEGLDSTYTAPGGAKMPVKGDLSKLHKCGTLTDAALQMVSGMDATLRNMEGTQQARSIMRGMLQSFAVFYGTAIMVTISPNEKHCMLMLRFHRVRTSDPFNEDPSRAEQSNDFTRRWGDLEQPEFIHRHWINSPEDQCVNVTMEDLANLIPDFDERRRILARDPLACVLGFRTLIQILLSTLFGVKVCPQCPNCNSGHNGCVNAFGSVAKPEGGILGLAEAYFASIEDQAGGALHAHTMVWVNTMHQHKTLPEVKDLLEDSLVQARLRTLAKQGAVARHTARLSTEASVMLQAKHRMKVCCACEKLASENNLAVAKQHAIEIVGPDRISGFDSETVGMCTSDIHRKLQRLVDTVQDVASVPRIALRSPPMHELHQCDSCPVTLEQKLLKAIVNVDATMTTCSCGASECTNS